MINNSENLPEISESSKASEIIEYTQKDLQILLFHFADSFKDKHIPYSKQILKY